MTHEPTFSFSGSGYDRAAEVRGDLDPIRNNPTATTIVTWRGKVLTENNVLVQMPLDHVAIGDPVIEVFLGRTPSGPVFATDISKWEPDADLTELGSFFDQSLQHHPDLPDSMGFAELRAVMTEVPKKMRKRWPRLCRTKALAFVTWPLIRVTLPVAST